MAEMGEDLEKHKSERYDYRDLGDEIASVKDHWRINRDRRRMIREGLSKEWSPEKK